MKEDQIFDVIIIGGSYAGLSAAMTLGRALNKVLIIDSSLPCNRQTPQSHNFLTRDGQAPHELAAISLEQVLKYPTVTYVEDTAVKGCNNGISFDIVTLSGKAYGAARLIFATGIRDILPQIKGLAECWGISVIHCPYCHGYEVRSETTGILANGEAAFEMVKLIYNWTTHLALYTNGPASLTVEQRNVLRQHNVEVVENKISRLVHDNGKLQHLVFDDGSATEVRALYCRPPFEQHCKIPEELGCELTELGHLKIDASYETTVKGVYACGDNASPMRSVANAVGMGNATGIINSKQIIFQNF